MSNDTIFTDVKGNIIKMEADYSKEVEKLIGISEEYVKDKKIVEYIEALLSMEKKTRNAADLNSSVQIVKKMIDITFTNCSSATLIANLNIISKRRGQLKNLIVKMVQEAEQYIDKLSDKMDQHSLINCLLEITEGKVYVERERVFLLKRLCNMKESEGNFEDAANLIQDIQVETFGSLSKSEKTEFILEQLRLCLLKEDLVRCQIISKKINLRIFDSSLSGEINENFIPMKKTYLNLMIDLNMKNKNYLSVSKYFYSLFEMDKTDKENLINLSYSVVYCLMEKNNNHQVDYLYFLSKEYYLEKLPIYKSFVRIFMTNEVIEWSIIEKDFEKILLWNKIISTTDKDKWFSELLETLKRRTIEHNVQVIAKAYNKITMQRLSEHLSLNKKQAETVLFELITDGYVQAKIDRPIEVVQFHLPKSSDNVLNNWASNIHQLLLLNTKISHLVSKEEMVHQM